MARRQFDAWLEGHRSTTRASPPTLGTFTRPAAPDCCDGGRHRQACRPRCRDCRTDRAAHPARARGVSANGRCRPTEPSRPDPRPHRRRVRHCPCHLPPAAPHRPRPRTLSPPSAADGTSAGHAILSSDGRRMRIDLLFIQLAVVFLPGLIWTQLAATYAMKERPEPTAFLVRAFIFGLLTYTVVYFAYGWFGKDFSEPPVGNSQRFLNVDFADELLWSSAVAFVFSLIWIYGSTRRWMTRLLNWAGAATTHGKEDIWDLTFRIRAKITP